MSVGERWEGVVRRGEERLEEVKRRGEVGVDEMVCASSIVGNQWVFPCLSLTSVAGYERRPLL